MSTGTATTSTTSTRTRPAIRRASRTPIGIATRRWCTATRTIPTCITGTPIAERV